MNFYNPYTGSKKKRNIRRAIMVIISALVITGATVIFGNHLKDKAESSAENTYMGIGRDDIYAETESQVIIPPSKGGSGASESVKGFCVPLGIITSEEDREAGLDRFYADRLKAAAEDNTGVLIPLTGDDGYLLYNSDRAREHSRLPANPYLPDMDALRSAVDAAKAEGLRVTAYIVSGVSLEKDEGEYDIAIAADSRIAADAAEVGFDEIIIASLVKSPDDITGDASHVILRYLNQMTAAAGNTDVGLSLPPEVYLRATLSPQIELFISRSVFLTMELTAEQSTENYLNYICENLAGTLSVYNMRILLTPTDTNAGESLCEKLKAVEHENYLFTRVPDEVKEEPEETTADETDDAADQKED